MRKFLKVAMSEELYNSLQFNANSLNITLSKYCREILKNGYIVKSNSDYGLVLYHLNKIGNNINQIARFANANKSLDIEIYNQLLEIENYLKELSNDNNSK
jgi:predicted transcriptional regulator